ncbi:MAG: MFS transporter [Candidatus Bipolaricaulota bacterium]
MRWVRAWDPERWAPTFFLLWGGQATSLLGSHLVQFALVWWLTKTTGSATVLAGATLVALLPQIVISPIAGTLVDRWNRRWVMIFADAAVALATLALAILFALDKAGLPQIYIAMFVRSMGGAFHWPAMQASTGMMVPNRHLARVGGLNQSLFGIASIVSPPLGALLLEILPMHGVLAIDVATAATAITPLLFIRIPLPARIEHKEKRTSVVDDLWTGFRFVARWRALFAIIVAAALINLFTNPAISLMPLLVTRHFRGGALELAGLQSAFGFGMVAGGLLLGLWGGFKRRMLTAMASLAIQGVGFGALGLVPPSGLAIAIGAMAVVGVMNPICNGALFAIVQSAVPHEMQGRVMSLLISGATAAAPLGLAVAGPVTDRASIGLWFLVAGAVMVGVSAVVLVTPALLRVEDRGVPDALRLRGPGGDAPTT